MDSTILAGIIGAVGTIIGALFARSDLFDKIIIKSSIDRITGDWISSWIEKENGNETIRKEIFHITKQKDSKIYGYITMESEPGKKWDLYGDFDNHFLRLFWHPSKAANNKLFRDYGCYFFERKGEGFKGYAVGFDYSTSEVEVYQHDLKQVKGD
ncbi:MAG: hypothetical protein AB1480_18575 [Nitrospirota bacterium]